MPDERTGFTMMWYNSPLHGEQNVGTLMDMIQVGQWYKFHAPQIAGKPIAPRRCPVPVKFRDMCKELQQGESSSAGNNANDECGSDDDNSEEDCDEDCTASDWEVSDKYFVLEEDKTVNLDAALLKDLILDTDPVGAPSEGKKSAPKEVIPCVSKPDIPNFDF
ncbi:hypothetical protein EV361DRAFT_956758 [Lentinula raphanica]|nr:hypothetical protein EV361DRAFT_956758 [Lentinula raphanica]